MVAAGGTGFTYPKCSAPAYTSGNAYTQGQQVSYNGCVDLQDHHRWVILNFLGLDTSGRSVAADHILFEEAYRGTLRRNGGAQTLLRALPMETGVLVCPFHPSFYSYLQSCVHS